MIDFTEMSRQSAGDGRRARPFTHYVWDGIFDRDALARAAAAFPDEAAMTMKPDNPRWHSLDRSPVAPPVAAVCDAIMGDDMIASVSRVTGVPGLTCDRQGDWGSYRISRAGAVHAAHVGTNVHASWGTARRYSLFTYLNDDWRNDYGATLELWTDGVDTPDVLIEPLFNRAVLIETTARSKHGVSLMTAPDTVRRKSITVHFWHRPA